MRKTRTAITNWLRASWAFARSSKGTTAALLIGILALGRIVLVQLRCLPLPLVVEEQHHWRQAFTYGVAWNFAHSHSVIPDFFHPHWWVEGPVSNLVAMEAPLYPWLGGLAMKIFGDGVFFMRLVSWLSLVATVVILFVWLGQNRRRLGETWADRAGLLLAAGLSISLGSDFRSVQPDAMAAGLAVGAAYFFVRYAEQARTRDIVLGGVLTSLAILTKPVVLGVVPALGLFGIWRKERWLRQCLFVGGAIALAVVPQFFWDRWAQVLLKQTGGGIVISIQHDPKEMLANLRNLNFTREGVLELLPAYGACWWLVPAIVGGMYRALAEPRLRRYGVPFVVWLVGYMIELLAFGDRLHSNYYYFVLAPAPLIFFGALGIGALIDVLDQQRPRPNIVSYRAAIITAIAAFGPLMAPTTNWNSVEASAVGFHKTWRVWTDDIGLARLLVGVLAAMVIAPMARKIRFGWFGPILVVGFLATAWPAAQSKWQYVRFYSAMEKRPSLVGAPELRAALDRYSSIDDRVLMSDPEPIWFYYARRNGFWASTPTPEYAASLRPRGARLYLHLKPTPDAHPPGKLLGSGPWWFLYCVAEDDCPAR
jgi:4-amino-4-deoxy-L-arabinose transferase-like glycosyltransferase